MCTEPGSNPTEEEFDSMNWSYPGVCVQVRNIAVGFKRGVVGVI